MEIANRMRGYRSARVLAIASVCGLMLHGVRALGQGTAATTSRPPATANKKSATAQKASSTEFGKSYASLRPQQKKLVDDFIGRYNQTTGNKLLPEKAYDDARLSVRTTFDAVTHALIMAKMTDAHGKSLGRAIDLVYAVDEVMGQETGVGGDRQYRLYVYLKPNTVETFKKSQEFFRDRDNTIYHKGFPTSYRLKNGPPSIQFSVSRDHRMADIDVDYRAEGFPKVLYSGHLTAANSDVRAGNNLERHDGRWNGLNGWWRDVFGGLGKSTPKEKATKSLGHIPLNPAVKAGGGVDNTAHDFLQSWVVEQKPNLAAAYLSRRSYACLESIARENKRPIAPGMVRLRTVMAMENYSKGQTLNSVEDAFAPATSWTGELKEAKNGFSNEFRLVSVPSDIGRDEECVAPAQGENTSKEKYFATVFREKLGRKRVLALLWAQEGSYWKIVAVRAEDGSDADIVPKTSGAKAAAVAASEETPKNITGDTDALAAITDFYQQWLLKRDAKKAAAYASTESYSCLRSATGAEKSAKPAVRIADGLAKAKDRIPANKNLADMMEGTQPVNELLRPVEQANTKAFAVMAVPDQMADSFLCENRGKPGSVPDLSVGEAKYGGYYLSASRLNFGDEESPALLLLWRKEKIGWKVAAWAAEEP